MAAKIKRSICHQLVQQEQLLYPVASYEPISTFDAADKKRLASPPHQVCITSFAVTREESRSVKAANAATFLRQVEQVKVYLGRCAACQHAMMTMCRCVSGALSAQASSDVAFCKRALAC